MSGVRFAHRVTVLVHQLEPRFHRVSGGVVEVGEGAISIHLEEVLDID